MEESIKSSIYKERISLLVIDNDELMLELFKESMSDAGYAVMATTEAEEGLRLAKEASPDIILLDIMMPKMDGYEVCRRLRNGNIDYKGRIIFVSAKALPEDRVKGLEYGADDYITKPFRAAELSARIRTQYRIKKAEDDRDKLYTVTKEGLELGAALQGRFLTKENETRQAIENIGYEISIFNRPTETISGDFFLLKLISDDSVGLFLADVSGHGMASAMISMKIISVIENIRSPVRHPSEFLTMINSDIHPYMPSNSFIAGMYLIFNRMGIVISNAAQPYPLLVNKDGVQAIKLNNPPLGQIAKVFFQDITAKVEKGDKLILYTDGLIEETDKNGEPYGEKRLVDSIDRYSKSNCEELKINIISGMTDHSGKCSFSDDVTLIVLQKR